MALARQWGRGVGLKVDPALLAGPLTVLARLWAASLRFSIQGEERLDQAVAQGRRVVVALWHDELVGATFYGYRKGLRPATVVSRSRDGELIARVLTGLGYATARGSSHRGGLSALRGAVRLLEEGRVMTVTVDGPRGPRHVAKEGAVYLASRCGALILPMRVAYGFGHVFARSWDRFQLPWPGSRVQVRLGEPFAVPQSLDAAGLDEYRLRLERALEELQAPS